MNKAVKSETFRLFGLSAAESGMASAILACIAVSAFCWSTLFSSDHANLDCLTADNRTAHQVGQIVRTHDGTLARIVGRTCNGGEEALVIEPRPSLATVKGSEVNAVGPESL